MTRDRIVEGLRQLSDRLRQDGIEHLYLFGSRARGDEVPESDLDLLVDLVPGHRFSLLDLSGVSLTIEDSIGIRSQIVLRRSIEPAFAERIQSDLVAVF